MRDVRFNDEGQPVVIPASRTEEARAWLSVLLPLLAVALLLGGGWGLLTVWITTPSPTASAPIAAATVPVPLPIASLPTLLPASPTPAGPLAVMIVEPTPTAEPTRSPAQATVQARKEATVQVVRLATVMAKSRVCEAYEGGDSCVWATVAPPTPTSVPPLPLCLTPAAGEVCFKARGETMQGARP